jgi:serine phosphatase RsbU (regulator of sigma subunit)/integral membrane sensor domain MASE1
LAAHDSQDARRLLYLAKIGVIAGAYYGSAKLGLGLAFETSSVTAIWPPTGIALAALVIWGRSVWPGVALGALLANLWTGVPLITVLGITSGNTLEAVVGAYLLTRVADFRPSLERVKDVLALVVLAGVISTAIAATVGVVSLIIGDQASFDDFGSVWRVWWLGDMGGDLLVAPVLLVAAVRWPFRGLPGHAIEAIALATSLVVLSVFVFHQQTNLAYLTFPLLVWAALRFWQPGATAAVLAVTGFAVYYTAHGHGPFVRSNPDDSLLLAQTFYGVAGLTILLLAAVVTERARAEETVAYIAGALQDGLLPPSLPEIPGIDLAARFRPVGEAYRVGGDFYDVFESRPGKWAVVIGDVSGKGPQAAAVTGLARHTLRTAALHDDSPSHVLNVLNGALRDRLSPREVCTVAYARLEAAEAGFAMTVLSGGHPLPLLLRSNGTVQEVGTHGLVLGASPELELVESTWMLHPGDCLLLYTDGLTEAYAPAYAPARPDVQSLLQSHATSSANEIAEDVYRRMLEFSPSEPRDDVALVVLRIGDQVSPDRHDLATRGTLESSG